MELEEQHVGEFFPVAKRNPRESNLQLKIRGIFFGFTSEIFEAGRTGL
jgi:hypothetical protein